MLYSSSVAKAGVGNVRFMMSGQEMRVMCVGRAGKAGMVIGSHGDRIIGSIVDEEGRASKEETKERGRMVLQAKSTCRGLRRRT